MAINRETSRDYFTSLLNTKLVTDLSIVQQVYGYKVGNPQGQSPIVAVLSAGAEREWTQFGVMPAGFKFEVQVWVLYHDADATPPWTEALAEDRLDLIERRIAEVIEDNMVAAGYWIEIGYDGVSTVADVVVAGGSPYILEKIPIYVEVE